MNTIRVTFDFLDTMAVPVHSVESTLDGDPICEAIKKELEDIEYVRQLVAQKRARALVNTLSTLTVEYKFY